MKKRLSITDVALCLAVSLLLMMVIWQDLDPRACVFFAFALGVAQIFVQIRWRMSMTCRVCGFDPVLYKKDPQTAAARVSAHLERRKEDPALLLGPSPRIPVVVKKADGRKQLVLDKQKELARRSLRI